jgi:hypothetical protein
MSVNLIISCFLTFCSTQLLGQNKLATEKGEISFVSNAELELIKASSRKLKGVMDVTSNQFAFSVQVNSFQGFNSELQREHFNEKYLESEKFPRMTFTGKIIEQVDITTDGVYDVRAKGDLEIHGQAQTRIIKSRIIVDEGLIRIEASFKVPLADHNISIPRIVNQKIATEIEVVVKADMMLQ